MASICSQSPLFLAKPRPQRGVWVAGGWGRIHRLAARGSPLWTSERPRNCTRWSPDKCFLRGTSVRAAADSQRQAPGATARSAAGSPELHFPALALRGAGKKKDSEPRTPTWILFFCLLNKASLSLVSFFFASLFPTFYFFFIIIFVSLPHFFFLYQLFSSAVANPARPSATPTTPIPSELILSESPVCIHRPRHASLPLQSAIPSRNPPLSPSRIR